MKKLKRGFHENKTVTSKIEMLFYLMKVGQSKDGGWQKNFKDNASSNEKKA